MQVEEPRGGWWAVEVLGKHAFSSHSWALRGGVGAEEVRPPGSGQVLVILKIG